MRTLLLIPQYKPRFVSESQLTELINLYHTSRIEMGIHWSRKQERMLWACREFIKRYPGIKSTAAYKDLSACLELSYPQ